MLRKPFSNDVREGIAYRERSWWAPVAGWPKDSGGSARESACGGGRGQRIRISDVEFGIRGEHSVGQQVTQLGLGPSVHNAVNDTVQVRAWADVVRDARGDDGQDISAPFAAFVEPREQPVAGSSRYHPRSPQR
jgi:hypothetical protein